MGIFRTPLKFDCLIPCALLTEGFRASYHEASPLFTRSAGEYVLVPLLRRFNSVDTDPSFWRPPSLASKHWNFFSLLIQLEGRDKATDIKEEQTPNSAGGNWSNFD